MTKERKERTGGKGVPVAAHKAVPAGDDGDGQSVGSRAEVATGLSDDGDVGGEQVVQDLGHAVDRLLEGHAVVINTGITLSEEERKRISSLH